MNKLKQYWFPALMLILLITILLFVFLYDNNQADELDQKCLNKYGDHFRGEYGDQPLCRSEYGEVKTL